MAFTTPGLDSEAYIEGLLAEYGLESLTDWAMDQLVEGRSPTEVLQRLRERPEFQQRFPAIEQRRAAGLAPLTPGEYVEYERRARQVMREAGLPQGFYDSTDDFTQFLTLDVSVDELRTRVNEGFARVQQLPDEVRNAFADFYGPDTEQALAAFYLDPDRAVPRLIEMAETAMVAGVGRQFGFGLSEAEAERVARQGAGGTQVRSGFEQLNTQRALFNERVGEEGEDLEIEDEGVEAVFGLSGESQEQIRRRFQRRQAEFAGGTRQAAGTEEGFTGIGRADR